MRYIELGKSGIKVSEVGIGTWQWGSKSWGFGKRYGKEDLYRAFKKALDLGINFFDTAELYGPSEEILGEFIKREGTKDIIIATKVSPFNASYEGTLKAAERSIKKLGVEAIDLYQIHWPNPFISLNETLMAFDKLYVDGKIKSFGLSNYGLKGLKKAKEMVRCVPLVSNQVKYNLIEREAEKELLPYMQREGLILIAYSPLAQGLLAGKLLERPPDLIRKLNPLFSRYNLKKVKPLIEKLKEIADRRGVSVTQVSINWLLCKENVLPIPGVRNERQVEEIASASEWRLKDYELKEIEEVSKSVRVSKLVGWLTLVFRLV